MRLMLRLLLLLPQEPTHSSLWVLPPPTATTATTAALSGAPLSVLAVAPCAEKAPWSGLDFTVVELKRGHAYAKETHTQRNTPPAYPTFPTRLSTHLSSMHAAIAAAIPTPTTAEVGEKLFHIPPHNLRVTRRERDRRRTTLHIEFTRLDFDRHIPPPNTMLGHVLTERGDEFHQHFDVGALVAARTGGGERKKEYITYISNVPHGLRDMKISIREHSTSSSDLQ